MKQLALAIGILLLSLLLTSCGASPTPTATPDTPTPVPSNTPTLTPTDTPNPTATPTATPTPSPTALPSCGVDDFAAYQRLLCAPADVTGGAVQAEWLRWCLGRYEYVLGGNHPNVLPLVVTSRPGTNRRPGCTYPAIRLGDESLPYVNGVLFAPLTPHMASLATFTPTATPTETPTPAATKTRKPPTPTPAPDLTALGEPAEPFSWEGANWPGFLAYNDQDFFVDQRFIHGRPVTIAWEKSAKVSQSLRREVTDFYLQTFIRWWEIFGGFPYPSYTVVLKSSSPLGFGEQGIGYEAIAGDYLHGYQERIAHEVFHAWIGNALQDADEQKYDDGLWFREGITQYYGDRGAGAGEYPGWMSDHWRVYKTQILGTEYDIPLTDMPAKGKEVGEEPGGANVHYRLNVYWKGALVAYMIDTRLKSRGLTLDDFLRYMYESFALQRRQFTTQDAIQALNAISGEDWADFFARYVYGTEALPLSGTFAYLKH